ncbi:hypothetical protein EIP91_007330 [Steccherinum ochraceum]|uniref:F-box domain-containing protein n=1 Tax=Steccherinum ochraceum TaxID=92696 RepID=A0A4R0RVC7_9APHY|nr:hypothetical protein EIP91_007330 [Steccherinum ochraceum]
MASRLMLGETQAFPAEIFDSIIDDLRHDHRALHSCALACKSFLPRARYHIFHSINLHRHNHARFRSLLRVAPHISAYIRKLRLQRLVLPMSQKFVVASANQVVPILQETIWITDTVSNLPVALTAVKRLEMEAARLDGEFACYLRMNLPNVQDLRLVQCSFNTVETFFGLSAALTSLQSLSLYDVYIKPCTRVQQSPYRPSLIQSSQTCNKKLSESQTGVLAPAKTSRFQSLRFLSRAAGFELAPKALQWLVQSGACHTLARLELPTVREDELSLLQAALCAAGTALRELTLGIAHEVGEKWDGCRLLLDLQACVGLEKLTFRSLKLRYAPTDLTAGIPGSFLPLSWLLLILKSISSEIIRDLNLRFFTAHLRFDETNHPISWSDLGQAVLSLPSLAITHPAVAFQAGLKRSRALLRLRMDFSARDTLMESTLPIVQHGLSALHGDERVAVTYAFQNPYGRSRSPSINLKLKPFDGFESQGTRLQRCS